VILSSSRVQTVVLRPIVIIPHPIKKPPPPYIRHMPNITPYVYFVNSFNLKMAISAETCS
jgi:hypothetical protein